MPVSDTVVVNVQKQTASPSRAGFGVLAIIAYHTAWPNRARVYNEASEMLDDGFTSDDAAYLAAVAITSQTPRPPSFVVGRRANAPDMAHTITVTTVTEGVTYKVTINGTEFTNEAGAGDAVADVAGALVTAINGGSEPVTATDNMDGTFGLAADTSGELYTLELSDDANSKSLEQENTTTDPGIVDDLNAIKAELDTWYGFALDTFSAAEIESAAGWAESESKIFSALTSDSGVPKAGTTDDVASTLQTSAYERTAISYTRIPHDYLAAAIMARQLTTTPGSSTWAHKTLAGVAADDLTPTEQTGLEGKNCNFYMPYKGRNTFFWGYTPSGEWIDTTRGIDHTTALAEEELFLIFASNEKVPFTQQGATQLGSTLESVLERKEGDGFFVPGSSNVTLPDVDDPSDVSSSDKQARDLPKVVGSARFAGAIHKTTLTLKLAN